ncbi:hypothetical protein C7S17_2848 [Burkholderia thailandensis]|nr:hypothetical protein [Burkholderia thailandensis]
MRFLIAIRRRGASSGISGPMAKYLPRSRGCHDLPQQTWPAGATHDAAALSG